MILDLPIKTEMNMLFIGWRRQVCRHRHPVLPMKGNYLLRPALRPGALRWVDPLRARGKVSGLALSGDFQVDLEFSEKELKNWLTAYLEADYERGLELMHSVQVIVTRKLMASATSPQNE